MPDLQSELAEHGYVIIRRTIPPERLNGLRATFEILVERQFDRWRRERDAAGQWPDSYFARQPRILIQRVVDASTAAAVELCLEEGTLGVSRRLMQAPHAAPTLMSLMCNPSEDHGPDRWHRDIRPASLAPLAGLQHDARANGPAYVQWNLPLYDDSVLWVVPGSHWRVNTDEENDILARDPSVPLPGGIPVELNAGDAVVYLNTMLHWGSDYSARLRRTIHLGYRAFGAAIYPHAHAFNWDLDFTSRLSADTRRQFKSFFELHANERRVIEAVLRAALERDADEFQRQLAILHPGAEGRMVALVLLSKLVLRLAGLARTDRAGFDRRKDIADAFSAGEIESIERRFAGLDAALRAPDDHVVPGFQDGPAGYAHNDMPAGFGVDEFIGSWGVAA
ncbi:MAG: phytanoyl-CoA dioxygenase family protein [Chloroflexi bacterium]|nr:phytanoyl-CoA dioxygenase family protein [Chloroflexota bacterium]